MATFPGMPPGQQPPRRVGTPAAAIADALRADIVAGRLAPGSRLPTRIEFERQYQASPVTVQRALDQLIHEGFAEARGRHGTFVPATPPSSHRWALVFPLAPGDSGWHRNFAGMLRESQHLALPDGEHLVPYFTVRAYSPGPDLGRLVSDIGHGRIAGAIFATGAEDLIAASSPVVVNRLPKVVIGRMPDPQLLTSAVCDSGQWLDLACAFLAKSRRRRVAMIGNPNHDRISAESARILEQHHLTTRPSWWVGITPDRYAVPLTTAFVRLLLDQPIGKRPDALLIGDDNLIPFAVAGLKQAGLELPKDLAVVLHANLPEPEPAPIPCLRLGIDLRRLLLAACGQLHRLRSGLAPQQAFVQPEAENPG